jgi:hypothetical protein
MKWKKPSEIEKNIQKEYLNTGILDLITGLYFIAIGIVSNLSQLLRVGVVFALIIGYHFIRRRVIQPRIGLYKFSMKRSVLFKFQNMIVAFFTLFFILLIILSRAGIFMVNQNILTLSVSILIILLSLLFAQLFSVYRLVLYGVLLGLMILLMSPFIDIMGETLALALLMIKPGILITIYGIYRLRKFVKSHPLEAGEEGE